ncbi:BAR adaptor protein [Diaporthe helianthi]|uniref:BAR adaptor protein n=1 Tax=Diaporthe helianthi TaxID=158607 RepID=A0A2P5HJK4_DIAHE|nr:BAR adaptor protein [Diaporthe helianthi]
MSFRGFSKSITRAPQTFKHKFNIGEHTKDAVYIDSERRFQELETETRKLHDESKKYFEAINSMLNHQIEFSKAIAEIYKPISGRMSDPDSLVVHANPEGIQACEEYEAVVKDLQETLAPELEMIESRVIRPANELTDVIKIIRKQIVKREHKKLDYDRHKATLKKLQDKKEKSIKDEKAMWKAENDVEAATQDYNYYNDLLKDELPKLFLLEAEFIKPLFQSFYYMQLNIFYTLHERMQRCDIGYFDLTLDIEEAFHQKRGDIQEQAEKLSIVKFKSTGQRRPPKYQPKPAALDGNRPAGLLTQGPTSPTPSASTAAAPSVLSAASPGLGSATPGLGSVTPGLASPSAATPTKMAFHQRTQSVENPPPPYSAGPTSPTLTSPKSASLAAAVAAKSKPPPPKPKPSRLSATPAAETVTALYDYSAQAEGDLSFHAGDVIEIVTRTQNENEWWIGKLHGKQGQFPGNYVQLG